MPFDVSLKFSVETQELLNAKSALQSLAQAANDLNKNQDKAAKAADRLTEANDKAAQSSKKAAAATDEFSSSTEKVGKGTESVEQRLARLKDQLGFLNGSLIQSETGLTKMQAGMLASMKAIGATDAQLKEFANTFDSFNKVTGASPFDKSLSGLKSLENQFRELSVINEVTAKGYSLTSTQVVNLARDIERLRQVNVEYGRDANAGIAELEQKYIRQASAVNELISKSQQLQQQALARANAEKVAADATSYLDRETAKLVYTNDMLSRGFTVASANALFKYKEALELAGVSANELKQKLYILEQELMKKQGTSPFARMQEDMQKLQQNTNHLARAVSTQLGDVFVSLASGQNLFTVMIQQGDQIRGALQQAKDAGQDLSKAMQGAFGNMASSFKLVGTVLKEFVADGFNTVAGSMQTVIGRGKELNDINKMLAEGSITPLRAQRLEYVALANAMNVLRIAALSVVGIIAVTLVKAFYDLSKEQDRAAQSTAQFGAAFGATSSEALEMSRSLRDIGISTDVAQQAMTAMMQTGTLTKESFKDIVTVAADVQKYVGLSIEEVVKKFGELGKDPVKTLEEFTLQTGYLSQSQIQLVRDLVEVGDQAKAQEVAIQLLESGYASMAANAKQDMSELGRAMVALKDSTSTLWDEFKNSTVVTLAINSAKVVFDVLAVSVHAVGTAIRDIAITAGFVKDLVSGGPLTVGQKWDVYTQSLEDNATAHIQFAKALIEGTAATDASTAADRAKNVSQQQIANSLKLMADANEENIKSQVKSMKQNEYVQARLEEDLKKYTKTLTEEQRNALVQSEKYQKLKLDAQKRYAKEWEEAQKKTSSSGAKPKETYKVDRSNELAETKKFYDEQLKQLKDAESKQEAILKQSYDAKMISFGEYYAKQTELTLTSQRAQLASINESSDKQKAAIQSRMLEHIAAFEKEVRAGGNVVELTNKLDAELANLTRTYGGVTQATDTQTQALQSATDKKFYEFYKELNKNLNESRNAFEKFSETVATNAANRQADLDLQRQLLNTYGAEAEALKAKSSAMRSYSSEIKKQTELLKKQDKLIEDMRKGRDSLTDAAAIAKVDADITKRLEERAEIEKTLNNTTALAKQDAEQAAIDAVAAYNLKVFQEVRDTISDALYDAIFEGGSKGADALKNVLKNAFKNFVINAYINPVVGNVVGSVMGAIGMGSGLPGVAGGGGGFSLGGGSFDIGQSLIDYGYDLAGTSRFLGDAVSNLGTGLKGFETTLKGIPGLEGGYGSVLGYGSALLSLSEGKYGSSLGTGIGTYLIPTLGPLAPMVGSVLGGFLDDTLGDLFSGGPPNLGSAYTYNTKTGASKEYGGPEDLGVEADKVTAQLMESTVAGINDLFKKLGSTAKVEDFWGGFAAREDGGDSAWAGGMLSNGVKFGQQWSKDIETELGSVEEAMKRYQEELSKATLDALKQVTDVPEYIQTKLKDVDVQALSGEEVTALIQEISNLFVTVESVNSSFDLLGLTLDSASMKSGEYQLSLVNSAGGMDAFATSVSGYYENFYSESERSAKAMESLTKQFADAGIEIPATREEYRKLVEAAAAGGDATKDQLASLLKLSGAFAQLVPNVLSLEASFKSVGDSLQGTVSSILQQVMLGKVSAGQAGSEVGKAFEQAVLNAVTGSAAAQIEQVFVASIIEPIIANILAGKAAAEGLDVEGAVQEAKQILSATKEIFANPEIRNGISSLTEVMGELGTAASDVAGGISVAASGISSAIQSVYAGVGTYSENSFKDKMPDEFLGVKTTDLQSQYGFAYGKAYTAYQDWMSKNANYGIPSGNPFAVGGSAPNRPTFYRNAGEWLDYQPAYQKMQQQTEEANNRRTEVMRSILESDKKATNAWEQIINDHNKLWKEGQGDRWKASLENAKNSVKSITEQIANFDSTFKYEYDVNGQITESSAKAAKSALDDLYKRLKENQDAVKWNEEATTELTERLRQWTLAQQRMLATDELVNLQKETEQAIAKTEELKLTGGTTDPIKSLMSSYREKLKNLDDNLGASLQEEIDKIKNRKISYTPSGSYLPSHIVTDVEAAILSVDKGISEAQQNMEFFQNKLKDTTLDDATKQHYSALIDAYKADIQRQEEGKKLLEEALKQANSGKQEEIDKLNAELQKYKDGIEEWKKAQAELLSTEMLIDINNQIKELETVEKGPLTTIKDAIQKYIDDFTELGTLTQEVQEAIDKLSGLQLNKAREELYNQLLSEDELKSIQQAKLSESFKDLGTELPASADALRSMIDAARAAGNITLADKLLELVPAFMALQGAADGVSSELDEANKAFDAFKRSVEAQIKELEKTFTATDLAMRVLEKAVEAEKKRLTEQLNTAKESVKTLQKIFDTLDKGIKDLRNEVDQTKKMQADEARRVIDVANLTGVLPDADRLSEAVSVLTTSVKDGLYATAYDKSRAFLTLANDLEKLKNTTEPQLTSAEQTVVNLETQIEQLDDLLDQARKQIDELRGIDASLFGIDEGITQVDLALKQLQNAAQAEEQARKQIDVLNQQLEMYQKQLNALNGIDTSVKSVEDAIRDLEITLGSIGSGGGQTTAPETGGPYPAPWEPETGGAYPAPWEPSASQSATSGEYIQIPEFAVGTNYVPKDMLANIHEGEMIIPKRFNPSTSGLQQDNSELVDELKALRTEVAMLRAEARATAMNTSKTARILDDVTQGGDTLKTEVAV